jgi:hypothetical protein
MMKSFAMLIAGMTMAAGLLDASTALAASKCVKGAKLCVNSHSVAASGGRRRVDRISASTAQSWCYGSKDYHIEILIKDNTPTYHASWDFGGITRWIKNGAAFSHRLDSYKCSKSGAADYHSLWGEPLNGNSHYWPKTWYACARLWRHDGGNHYTAEEKVCAKL